MSGEVVFVERGDIREELLLPCGQCTMCRLERSRQWAVRCQHEATLHKENAFITLTYSDEYCPGQLEYQDYQKFMRRLRKRFPEKANRFFMCGEYGPQLQRPHYHACLFGTDFPDKTIWQKTSSGSDLYRSKILEELWPWGHSSVGELTYASAAYTARYCMKKTTGWNARWAYGGKTPEFVHMSLKPGIGAKWIEKWQKDVYPHDYVIINGVKTKPPKYYDMRYKKINEASYEEIKTERLNNSRQKYEDNTPQRLQDKEECAKAKIRNLKRTMYQ